MNGIGKIELTVEVKPYQIVFIQKKYLLKGGNKITRNDILGMTLISLLNPKDSRCIPLKFHPKETCIKIDIGANSNLVYLIDLKPEHQADLVKYIDDLIKFDFVAWMDAGLTLSGTKKSDLIRMYLDKYGFVEDGINYGRLEKWYVRYLSSVKEITDNVI